MQLYVVDSYRDPRAVVASLLEAAPEALSAIPEPQRLKKMSESVSPIWLSLPAPRSSQDPLGPLCQGLCTSGGRSLMHSLRVGLPAHDRPVLCRREGVQGAHEVQPAGPPPFLLLSLTSAAAFDLLCCLHRQNEHFVQDPVTEGEKLYKFIGLKMPQEVKEDLSGAMEPDASVPTNTTGAAEDAGDRRAQPLEGKQLPQSKPWHEVITKQQGLEVQAVCQRIMPRELFRMVFVA